LDFRIADTFTDALARLPAQEQKAVKTSAFDLQLDPSGPGLQFHRIQRSKDPNFWSMRVSRDLRIIVHKTAASLLLAYVDHHDRAYAWAERRRIEAHPSTGAVQIVEVRERVEEAAAAPPVAPIPAPTAEPGRARPQPAPPLFASLSREDLLAVGVPPDWLDDVAGSSDDGFLELATHLPAEAAEALLEYAASGSLVKPAPVPAIDGFSHPDALRRFRTVENLEELQQALDAPWEKWAVFLHPSQSAVVQRDYAGPARVAGSAGTGKTVVALHRAVRLAQGPDPTKRVLLTTFSRPLATALERKLKILAGPQTGVVPRITVAPLREFAAELHQLAFGTRPRVATGEQTRSALMKAAEEQGVTSFSPRFMVSEWIHVVDAWQLAGAKDYAAVPRLGRKSRIGAKQRDRLWPVFEAARRILAGRGLITWPQLFHAITDEVRRRRDKPFAHIVMDEAQDLSIPELRFLAALAPDAPNALFFAGDLGQRIFQQPFSWKGLGVDVRGRSSTLKVNYRTSHQIRQLADELVPTVVRDVDGLADDRIGTVSVFNGPAPTVVMAQDEAEELARVAAFLGEAAANGIAPGEVGIFVRSRDELPRARAAAQAAGTQALELSQHGEEPGKRISIGTMHLAKGLEFKAVVVMACDDEVLPLQSRLDAVADEVELEEVYATERHLFYVACTRARDRLLVSGVSPGSEFLEDLAVRRPQEHPAPR
jgi:hypothetical protein